MRRAGIAIENPEWTRNRICCAGFLVVSVSGCCFILSASFLLLFIIAFYYFLLRRCILAEDYHAK